MKTPNSKYFKYRLTICNQHHSFKNVSSESKLQETQTQPEAEKMDSVPSSAVKSRGTGSGSSPLLPRFINQLIGDGKEISASTSHSSLLADSPKKKPLLEESVSDLLHAKIEQRSDFTVTTADIARTDRAEVSIRVQIDDSDDFSQLDCASNILKASNLRKLLYSNPHIALILHDCIIEEGLQSTPYN